MTLFLKNTQERDEKKNERDEISQENPSRVSAQMTTNINSYSSSQMKHIAFSKPRVDDDSRVEALDALTMMLFEEEENKEEEMMMMSEALTSEVLDASNSTLIRAKCFALLQRMNERSACE